MPQRIDFQTDPSKYRHWRVEYDGEITNLFMDVDEKGGLFPGYELKLNSYDLGVDIELADVIQRMRFEHPEVKVVVMQSAKDRVFCAGANIRMLGGASHAHKVNFCKFTNETRNTYEAAEADSGQKYIAAIKGSCAGGGYELALACNHIILTNDSTSSVALPEVPLLAVLPGTGGLTRVTDKRKVRRDLADVFCSVEEGVRGQRAVDWKLVDEIAPNSKFDEVVQERARAFADDSAKASGLQGIELTPLTRSFGADGSVTYSTLEVGIDRDGGRVTITVKGPEEDAPADTDTLQAQGADSWMLRLARELDDAILHLRLNERETGLIVFHTQGDPGRVLAHEKLLLDNRDHWLANEILHYWKRVLKRIDVTSRSLVALVEHGSCYAGVLAELLWAVDRSYMMLEEFEGDNRPLAAITLSEGNFGTYPMSNDLSRLATRFWADTGEADKLRDHIGEVIEADEAEELGLITYAFDDIDWKDEVRIFLEERASFSPDAMTGMEANLRFVGPETMETRIFGRLTAWQNWIFQRPNAVGEDGALKRYGSGVRGKYDMERV
ncbi:2,3-epoxybenzoyl-CoA dihydrolase [Ruegeria sp. HKCCD8929]|uniref:2,3-epoxybenzoyl-CoA dihydrolase n=1 Tax=Ruegeria sp. HKCCD8929 TaxID=2683006 RepID=UPI0014899601|nr:2,3-epoxybenzoyl-CoA dihydrolase [Ruegeria sp. HKCCD8929]